MKNFTSLLALGLCLVTHTTSNLCLADHDEPLSPDLITLPLNELRLTFEGGRKLLRLTNAVGNKGDGPFIVIGKDDGSPALQLIATGATRDKFGSFRSNNFYTWLDNLDILIDSEGGVTNRVKNKIENGYFKIRDVGYIIYHPEHGHLHVNAVARYELLLASLSGPVVSVAEKVSFALMDMIDLDLSKTWCWDEGIFGYYWWVQGISKGCADEYWYDLYGQDLDVTGLPDGVYYLKSTANPENRFKEERISNNANATKVRITGSLLEILETNIR